MRIVLCSSLPPRFRRLRVESSLPLRHAGGARYNVIVVRFPEARASGPVYEVATGNLRGLRLPKTAADDRASRVALSYQCHVWALFTRDPLEHLAEGGRFEHGIVEKIRAQQHETVEAPVGLVPRGVVRGAFELLEPASAVAHGEPCQCPVTGAERSALGGDTLHLFV